MVEDSPIVGSAEPSDAPKTQDPPVESKDQHVHHEHATHPPHEAHTHTASEPHKEHVTHVHEKKKFAIWDHWMFIVAFVLYLAVALVMFYPITLHITSVAPGTGGDTYQNLWDIWWVNYAVFHLHTNPFYTTILYWPIGVSLAYATLAPLLGIISAPFQAVGGTVFAYNIMFFMGFVLSGLTMYILAEYLTKNHYAALLSGFIFTFSSVHIAQGYSHIHFTNIEFIPLFLYFFLLIVNGDRHWFNIVGMAASFALTTLIGNVEQTLMVTLLLVYLLIVYIIYKDTRKKLLTTSFVLSMVGFVILALIIGLWNFLPLIRAVTQSGGLGTANYLNNIQSNVAWSDVPVGFLVPSYFNGLIFSHGVPTSIYNLVYAPDPVESVSYIGFVVLALTAYGIYRYGKKMLPWIVGALLFIWLALGPFFILYQLYHALPGINVIREPGRFDLIVSLFFAILAAYGAKALFEKLEAEQHHPGHKPNRNMVYILLAVLILAMFIENNGLQLGNSPTVVTTVNVPKFYDELSNLTGNFSVLELPALPAGSTPYFYPGIETYYTSVSHKPIVGGYVGGRQNITTNLLLYNIPLAVQAQYLQTNGTGFYPSPVIENYSNQTLLTLYNYNTEVVTIQKNAYNASDLQDLEAYLYGVFGDPIYNDNSVVAFQTEAAINRSIFRSFVSYPIIPDWSSTTLFVNGTNQLFWVPTYPGGIVVYAPFLNGTRPVSTVSNPYAIEYTNTTISFTAFANQAERLYILESSGSNSSVPVAQFNLTTTREEYSATTKLIAGPQGNLLYIVYQYNNSQVLLSNITFTKGP